MIRSLFFSFNSFSSCSSCSIFCIFRRYSLVKVANAEGLKDCRRLLTLAKAGKYNGYLLEGMACPGGCVAGAGTMQPIKKSQAAVNLYAAQANHKISNETEYVKELNKLVE